MTDSIVDCEAVAVNDTGAASALAFLKLHTAPWRADWFVQVAALEPDGRMEAHTVPVSGIDALAPWIGKRMGHCNLYFAVNPLKKCLGKKASKPDIAALAYLHVDLDPAKDKDLSAERKRLLLVIQGFSVAPTHIIDSGGGYGVFWRLAEAIPNSGDPALLEDLNQRLALHLGGDNCHNIDRIMRLPGTTNLPDARKMARGRVATPAVLIEHNDVAYAAADFAFLPAAVEKLGRPDKIKVEYESVDTAATELKFETVLSVNPELARLWNGGALDWMEDKSRSGFDFALALLLTRISFDNGEIYSLLHKFKHGKVWDVKDVDKYVGDILGKIRARELQAEPEVVELVIDSRRPATLAKQEVMTPFPPPFRGAMEEAVNAALKIAPKPQLALTTLAALIAMASGCGSYYRLPSDSCVNLYGCGIAETGAGKDAPLSLSVNIGMLAGARLLGKPGSGQGLEDALVDHTGMLCEIDEVAHFFAAINASKAPAHLIELAATMLRLFSASKGIYHGRVLANGKPPRNIQNPSLSLISFATPEKLGAAVNDTNVADGLAGRFLFAFGEENVTPRRIHEKMVMPEAVKKSGERVAMGKNFALLVGETAIAVDANAELLLQCALLDFDKRSRTSPSPFAKALQQRSFEKCERIAGVMAVWDDPGRPIITAEHVAWASQVVRASDAALLRFTEDFMHGGEVQADCAKLRPLIARIIAGELSTTRASEDMVVREGWAPQSMLLRLSKFDAKRLASALAQLVILGDIEIKDFDTRHPNGRVERMRAARLADDE